jgi:hypothetical protein
VGCWLDFSGASLPLAVRVVTGFGVGAALAAMVSIGHRFGEHLGS